MLDVCLYMHSKKVDYVIPVVVGNQTYLWSVLTDQKNVVSDLLRILELKYIHSWNFTVSVGRLCFF